MKLSDLKPAARRLGAEVSVDGRPGAVVNLVRFGRVAEVALTTGETIAVSVTDVELVRVHPFHQHPPIRKCLKRDAHTVLDEQGRCSDCGLVPGAEPEGLLR